MPPAGTNKWNDWTNSIHKQLTELSYTIGQLNEQIINSNKELSKEIEEKNNEVKEKMQALEKVIFGTNPDDSMIIRMDRLEQANVDELKLKMDRLERGTVSNLGIRLDRLENSEKSRTWLTRTTIGSAIVALVSALLAILHHL